ncbi:MAG: phosphate signaling complex protein PhoU [Syntrophomonadaceae bacterium]|nr:phosphate signaling complex protein PhoU [Syntrophomonadaceae bacterium]
MSRSGLNRELTYLQGELLRMGTLVEELIYKAVKSMINKDQAMAQEVIDADDIVDQMMLDIELKCLSVIARQQPMAKDLRSIGTILRIITDLERIADHTEDIAEITINLMDQPYMKPLIDIPRMGDICRDMLKRSIKSYINEDTELAWSLIEDEKTSDALYNQIFRELLAFMLEDPKTINQALSLLLAAGHLERIADHITNLGEMVVYLVDGERVDFNRISRETE